VSQPSNDGDDPMEFQTFGIVGYGHFGKFLADSLSDYGKVLVTDVDAGKLESASNGVRAVLIDEVVTADVVILAVPFTALREVLDDIRDSLPGDTVVMDVISTKAHASYLLESVLSEHPHLLATHPLFGPPSMQRIGAGDRLVVTYERGRRAAEFRGFLEARLGLEIVEVSPREHDEAMAYMQSLPFFIARALVRLDLPFRDELTIPSYRKLAEIAAIEEEHTVDMFDTSQVSNPYAEDARRHFLEVLGGLQREIEEHAARGPALALPDLDDVATPRRAPSPAKDPSPKI